MRMTIQKTVRRATPSFTGAEARKTHDRLRLDDQSAGHLDVQHVTTLDELFRTTIGEVVEE